jgi:hypothetical protein
VPQAARHRLDLVGLWPVSPFVRRRWRRRLGLPECFVAEVGVATAPPLDDRTAYEALFLCAAAVVDAEHLLPALALGTPVVCGSDAAAAAGAVDGEHVVVADTAAEARAAADALAGDDVRAAALARAGRHLVVVPAAPAGPEGRVGAALAELGTPPGSDVARRVAAHVAALMMPSDVASTVAAVPPLPDEASARRVAAAYGLPALAPEPIAPEPTLRDRLRGKSLGQIVRAAARRVRP